MEWRKFRQSTGAGWPLGMRIRQAVTAAISVLVFAAVLVWLPQAAATPTLQIKLGSIAFESRVLAGILTQVQMAATLVLILSGLPWSTVIALVMNIAALFLTIQGVMVHGQLLASTGIFVYACAIFTVLLVAGYKRRIRAEVKALALRNGEIAALNRKLAATEITLADRNRQLQAANGVLEEQQQELHRLAYYDELTALPNRRSVLQQLEYMVQSALEQESSCAVVFVDLDHFKTVNDALGHQKGDAVLLDVVERLGACVHSDDVLGRLSGDEFALLIARPLTPLRLQRYLDTLCAALSMELVVSGSPLGVSASLGVAVFPANARTPSELLHQADLAMYEAKSSGRNTVCFSAASPACPR